MDALPFINMFTGKTKVTFIHAITGKILGTQKVKPEHLPASFNKPTNIEFEGAEWRVLQAKPIHAKEFKVTNKLTLHIQEPASIYPEAIGSDYPTICNNWPELVTEPLFSDSSLDISKDMWRQIEFFPSVTLPFIQEEMIKVETILFPKENVNTLRGYQDMYIRKEIHSESLNISFDEFCKLVYTTIKGSIKVEETNFVKNSFVVHSDNYTYYGTIEEDKIKQLCITQYESMDEELCQVCATYDLALVDWCNGKIIMS